VTPGVLRLVLGGLLVLSGTMKLGLYKALGISPLAMDPLDFAFSLKAFKLGLGDGTIGVLTYAVPWGEALVGACLVLGVWTRGAALGAVALMFMFGAGIASLLARDIPVNCPCFGKLKLFCGDRPLGLCHLVRNGVFALAGVAVLWLGPGRWSLDAIGLGRGRGGGRKAG
jgi:uncharacterized membrane protein YphA (DoxX/SURF4 family)